MKLLLSYLSLLVLMWSGKTFADKSDLPVTRITVKEDDDVILPCTLGSADITSKLFDWKKDGQKEVFMYDNGNYYSNGLDGQDEQFKGRVSHFSDQLKSSNASIVVGSTKVSDSGRYTCDFPKDNPTRRSLIELTVECILKDRIEEKIPGTCPKPTIKIRNEMNDGFLVECQAVGGHPKPELELQDSNGTTVSTKNVLDIRDESITLQILVTRRDFYHCVMKQRGICHEIFSEPTLVPVFVRGASVVSKLSTGLQLLMFLGSLKELFCVG